MKGIFLFTDHADLQPHSVHVEFTERSLLDLTKKSKNKSVATDIRAIFNAPNGDEAKRQLDLFIDKYQTSKP